jgi:choline kinase
LAVNSECITINGDDLFKLSVINSLISSKGDIVMTTSIKKDYDSDDMLVFQENNQVYSVGKDLDKNKANGESAGIIKYTLLGLSILRETLDEMMKDSENHQKFYLLALQKIMNRGVPINTCNIDFNDWAEIDFHPDVKDVRSKVDFFVKKIHSE